MKEYNILGRCFLIIVILYGSIIHTSGDRTSIRLPNCLTGYMTDYQTWVDEFGSLRTELGKFQDVQNALDLSSTANPVLALHESMNMVRATSMQIKYLSMARCNLNRIPPVFDLKDTAGRMLSDTIEYLTFYGNTFVSQSEAGEQYDISFNATNAAEVSVSGRQKIEGITVWPAGFLGVNFKNLKELDLRACSIQIMNANLFQGMRQLEALYLGENEIHHIDSQAFERLVNLRHLDLSRNQPSDDSDNGRLFISDIAFDNLKKLTVLDLSYTKLTSRISFTLRGLSKSLRSLSLCETGLTNLPDCVFNGTSLQILDVSRNNGVLSHNRALRGLERTLQVLFAKEIGLQSIDIFENFIKLDILRLSYNEINLVRRDIVSTMSNLRILDLDKNRLTTWFEKTYSTMPKLQLLSIRDNNINLISEEMITDMLNITYVALSGNFIVCNCHVKDFYKMAAINEKSQNKTFIAAPKNKLHHTGFDDYNMMIELRFPVRYDCKESYCDSTEDTGIFRLLDYDVGTYMCMVVPGSKSVKFFEIEGCGRSLRDNEYDNELARGKRTLLALLAIPFVLLPAAILFMFRRNLRYCFIMFRNSAMIGLINRNETIDDGSIFIYDVFVSYCNEDRGWVLDHLLPHIESDCSISACLHERDFQVGLSILENIVSCMDRSRSIMLIISKRFLLSQWCQFEMHLAQHRLLETRREDLTLVLLEDIPRRLRPNTLHYLMLTKTYIVWPSTDQERTIFWRRIKKSLVSQKVKQTENVSLA